MTLLELSTIQMMPSPLESIFSNAVFIVLAFWMVKMFMLGLLDLVFKNYGP